MENIDNDYNLTPLDSCRAGFNTIYDKNLSDGLKKIFAKHQLVWNGAKSPARPDLVLPSKTIRAFDDAITRHTFGEFRLQAQRAAADLMVYLL